MKALTPILATTVYLLTSLIAFSETPTPSHHKQPGTFSRPIAAPLSGTEGSLEGRLAGDTFQYRDSAGNWREALLYYRADKDGSFLNQAGKTVQYSKGDILFKIQDSGWFKSGQSKKTAVPNPDSIELNEVETLVIQFTNEERVKRGLPALKVSPRLQDLSRKKAKNMAKSQNLSHNISPLPPGGENIAWNQANAREVVRSWMNSSGHRANILNPRYSTIGASVANGNGPYWAQMFQ